MKKLLFLAFLITTSSVAFSQATQTLPKEWVGSIAHTNVGFGGKYNSEQQSSEKLQFNSYSEPRTLTILDQEGQSLKLLYKAGATNYTLIGTLSADGKQLSVANETSFATLNIIGDRMIGCGTSRGGRVHPSYEEWTKSYATWCVDLRVAK